MLISTDYITPAELTGYVRGALGDLQANQFTLSRYLPNRSIDDLDYRFTKGGAGLVDAAVVRTYDAESPIGKRVGLTRVQGELPPISRKIRLSEYDRLRQRKASSDAVLNAVLNDAVTMTKSVAARIEMFRGELLVTGKATISENGVVATVDFGRAAGHTVSAGTVWSDTATSVPITDLMSWQATYVAANGVPPGRILLSTTVLGYLASNAQIRGLLASNGVTPGIVTQQALGALLTAFGLPAFEVYDAQVKVAGSATRVIAADKVVLVPAPGAPDDPESTDLGATLWGTTAEALEPEYAIEDDSQPGVVAGAYSTKDPVAIWTKAAAIALPVLANPDLSFCADVA